MVRLVALLITLAPAVVGASTVVGAPVADAELADGQWLRSVPGGGLEVSLDGGSSFAAVPAQDGPAAAGATEIRALQPLTAGVLAVDDAGRVFRQDPGEAWGRSWSGLPVPLSRRTDTALLAADGKVVVLLLRVPTPGVGERVLVYGSGDQGRHWFPIKELAAAGEYRALELDGDQLLVITDGPDGSARATSAWRLAVPRLPDQVDDAVAPPRTSRLAARVVPPPDYDAGGVFVLYDDGTLMPDNDLQARVLRLQPIDTQRYQASFDRPDAILPFGEELPMTDDVQVARTLPFPFPFYEGSYTDVYISDNGNLTLGVPNSVPDAIESVELLTTGPPRIAAMWDDLTLGDGGRVLYDAYPDLVRITWFGMSQFGVGDFNTFQIELSRDGAILLRWDVGGLAPDALVGISPGGALASVYSDLTLDAPLTTPALTALYEEFRPGELRLDRVMRRFYHCNADDYDQVVLWASPWYLDGVVGGPDSDPVQVRNDVLGLGVPVFDDAAAYSSGRLQSIVNMGRTDAYVPDPSEPIAGSRSLLDVLTQMLARRFSGNVRFNVGGFASDKLLRTGGGGWSFLLDSDASVLGGNRMEDAGPGRFTTIGATDKLSPLDQYLMGVRDGAEVPEFRLIENVTAATSCGPGNCGRDDLPRVGSHLEAEERKVGIPDIVAIEGPRVPAYGVAPAVFHQAWILLIPGERWIDPTELELLADFQVAFDAHLPVASDGRATVAMALTPTGVAPTGQVGNALRAFRSGHDVVLDWRGVGVDPARFNVHGTHDKRMLTDDLNGIVQTPVIAISDTERVEDTWAVTSPVTRPSPYFYEVFPRDCGNVTVLP